MPIRKPYLFLLPFIAWLLMFYSSIVDMVNVWGTSKTYEHCFLIIPISLWVLWQHKKEFKIAPSGVAWLPIILMLFPASLWLLGLAAKANIFEHAAAIFSLQLLLWAMLGNAKAKVAWFPIAFLVFCIPFGEELIPRLQIITADLSIIFLQLSNIPVYRDGLYLTIPNGQFFVAEACSGIRFLISSLALGTLFAYLQFTKTWKRIAFVGFSFIFPIIANGIRAYGIILIGYLSDMKYATGADHLVYGWFFFSIVILCIFFTASLFADNPTEQVHQHSPLTTQLTKQSSTKAAATITLIFFSFTLWGQSITHNHKTVTTPPTLLADAKAIDDSIWGINFPDASLATLAVNNTGDTYFYTARYALWQPTGELISSRNTLFDKDIWSIQQQESVTISNNANATTLSLISQGGSSMKVVYWYCVSHYCSSDPLSIKLTKASQLLRGEEGYADIYAIASQGEQRAIQYAQRWQASFRQKPE
ncbi:exosortase A [Photobacterium makurazakiensis]|uniref:exosortase A n=1 Tax=Photobacterium makurazakiensis TaxID=2910234 RepID=UPI003D123F77